MLFGLSTKCNCRQAGKLLLFHVHWRAHTCTFLSHLLGRCPQSSWAVYRMGFGLFLVLPCTRFAHSVPHAAGVSATALGTAHTPQSCSSTVPLWPGGPKGDTKQNKTNKSTVIKNNSKTSKSVLLSPSCKTKSFWHDLLVKPTMDS